MRSTLLSKTLAGIVVVAMLAVGFAALPLVAGADRAWAQDRPRTIFDMLFSPLQSRERAPEREREAAPPPKQRRATAVPRAAPAPPPPAPVVEKAADARVVLVVGDFLASGIAEGLDEAYRTNTAVRVVEKTSGSSGIVRDDHYDWLAEIGPLIDAERPAVVVIMIGSNDRQEMRIGQTREPKRSDAWTTEYQRRVSELAKVVRSKGVPLLWVGMVPFRQNAMSTDMIAFNDIYRGAVEQAGGTFVDIWDGFVDESGAYVTSGPDVNGNPVRLRTGDSGINLTKAGKRKAAFYAEKPLERILGLGRAVIESPGALQPLSDQEEKPSAPVTIDRTVPMSLSDPEIDGGSELLGGVFKPASGEPLTPGEKLAIKGLAPPPIAGRADDFGGEVRPAAAPVNAPAETGAIAAERLNP